MSSSRRDFLKIAGLTAGGVGLGLGGLRLARAEEHLAEAAESGVRWAMVIDLPGWIALDESTRRRIIDACHRAHNVPDFVSEQSPVPEGLRIDRHEIKWIWEEHFENAFPNQYHPTLRELFAEAMVPVLCNHCERPACVRVCPTQATWKRDDGIVMMDMHRCIGCRYCIMACPFGARSFNFRDPRAGLAHIDPGYPTRMRGVVEKCNFCSERIGRGESPLCVEAAGEGGPLIFGDINEENGPVRQALRDRYTIRRKPEMGTEPHVFYIVA